MMYSTRQMKVEDLPDILELISEFKDESLGEYGISSIAANFRDIIGNYVDLSRVLVFEGKVVGVIAGFQAIPIGCTERAFQEVVWFVSKKHRRRGVKLYRDMEKVCIEKGLKYMLMGHMGNLKAEKLGQFYKAMGYKVLEIQYIKTIGGQK